MKMLARVGLALSAILASTAIVAPAYAQTADCASYDATGTCVPGLVLWNPATKGPYAGAAADPGLVAATSTPLTGTSTATAQVVGPFTPQLKRQMNLILAFNGASGTVQLLRSKDATQANAKPITALGTTIYSFTTDAQEQIGGETQVGATYWISLPAVAGITYDLRQ